MIRLDTFVGEIGKIWQITIEKPNPSPPPDLIPRDLSGAIVELIVERNVTKTGDVVDPIAGRVDFTIEDGDYPTAGVFEGRIRVSNLPGPVTTFTEKFRVNVAAVPLPG
jgi:hypothetical protein